MAERSVKRWSIEVPVPQDVAFAYLADVNRHAEWSPKPFWIDPPVERPLAVGTRFTSHGHIPGDKDHTNEVEVVEFGPPHTLVLASSERGDRYVHRFEVAGTASGCEIVRTVDSPKPTGALGLLFPVLFALLIKPEVSNGMEMLRSKLSEHENDTQPSG